MSSAEDRARRVWRRVKGPLQEARRLAGALRKKVLPTPRPAAPDGKVRVHLGCGPIDLPGYVNVDMMPLPHVHFVGGVQQLGMFGDGEVDLLYACHVLEHVPRRELKATLQEWRRVLRAGGLLRLSVPDFDLLVGAMQKENDVAAIQDALFGSFEHTYDVHHSAFTGAYLTRLLVEAGFRDVRPWTAEEAGIAQYGDWSSRKIRGIRSEHFISLNLEATR